MSIVGDNIRALRELQGITQQELADAIHVSRETVNKWESGAIESLREHSIALLRDRYGLSIDDLRSERKGLAAQLRMRETAGFVPVRRLKDGSTLDDAAASRAFVSDLLWRDHPAAFAIEMDSSMSRVLPEGCLALVDPKMMATNGSIVFAEVATADGPELIVRRLHFGSTMALLSAESYKDDLEDIVIDASKLRILGTVFWYQAPRELT